MIFNEVSQQTPATKQLIINNTHLDPIEDRKGIFYDNGIPDRLTFNCLSNKQLSLTVPVNPIMVIGRKRSMSDYEVNIDLTDMDGASLGVSRYHAMMLALDNQIYIKDLDSMNGMLLNGKRMRPSKEYVIDHGDIVAFGNLEVKIRFEYDK